MHHKDEFPEIPEEILRCISNAKRHHYVPEFLLRRFSTSPEEQHPLICRLDVKTGTISKLSTLNCAVVQHYNRLSATSDLPSGFPEGMLSYAESRSAPIIEKLVFGEMLDERERVDLSIFIMIQQQRTPRGREWQRFGQEQAAKFWFLKQLYERPDRTREILRGDLSREPTEAEVNESIRKMAESIESGQLMLSVSPDQEILGMFVGAPTLIPLIYDMNWMLLRAPEGQSFILSDDPLVRHDPANPGGPAGWRSSPTVEVTLPLDPQLCLLLRQPPLAQREIVITAEQLLDINLRTYAGVREAIFSPTEQLLESVSAVAKANEVRVDLYRPKPPTVHFFERMIEEDKPFKVTTIHGPRDIKIRRSSPTEQ